MRKINQRYISLFEYLSMKNYPFARWFHKHLYLVDYQALKDKSILYSYGKYSKLGIDWAAQWRGGMQHWVSVANDMRYTIKPYNDKNDLWRDILQPARGFKNIFRGAAILVLSPLMFLFFLIAFPLRSLFTWFFGDLSLYLRANVMSMLTWSADGLFCLIRGVIQLATTPLNWFLRMPLRGILTGIYGPPDILEHDEMGPLINQVEECLSEHSGTKFMKDIEYVLLELRDAYLSWNEAKFGSHKNIHTNQEVCSSYNKLYETYNDRKKIYSLFNPVKLYETYDDRKKIYSSFFPVKLYATYDDRKKIYSSLNPVNIGFFINTIKPKVDSSHEKSYGESLH
ncbi:MAG: hypothetical protein Q8M40_00640 [Legionella sp.]|nr:hypothetical protein [Legionella sp.]